MSAKRHFEDLVCLSLCFVRSVQHPSNTCWLFQAAISTFEQDAGFGLKPGHAKAWPGKVSRLQTVELISFVSGIPDVLRSLLAICGLR